MKKIIIFIFLMPFFVKSQIIENFDYENFEENILWTGNLEDFTINSSQQLKLNAENAGTSFIILENNFFEKTSWEFWIKQSFNSSANNYTRIYFFSDNENLNDLQNAYFLQIGGSNDSLNFFKKNLENEEKIFTGSFAFLGNSTNALKIKVERDEIGVWKIFSKNDENDNFVFEGAFFENTYNTSNYFGIFCKYTSSNSKKFYFDDILIKEIVEDTISPKIENFEIISQHQIKISFSEEIEKKTAENINNYFVNFEIGKPNFAILENSNEVILTFESYFLEEKNYNIIIKNIEDLNENRIFDTNFDFVFFEISAFDIVINEIMADPTPVVEMPEFEYIELFNNSNFDIFMENWTLNSAGVSKKIPNINLKKDSFLILCKTSAFEELSNFGKTVAITSFPSLTNSGKDISIKNENGEIIDSVFYKENWYQDEEKNDGGYSLERIDPNNVCGELQNWCVSADEKGGTPSEKNSVLKSNLDFIALEVLEISILDTNNLLIIFSENININSVNLNNFILNDDPNSTESFYFEYENSKNLVLFFKKNFFQNETYNLEIRNIKDLCDNELKKTNFEFVYHKPDAFDILINEIMADPSPSFQLPEFEYIEIFNKSNFDISLRNWILEIGDSKKIIPNYNFKKNTYLLICKEENKKYFENFGNVLGISSLTLKNDGEIIILRDHTNKIIHSVNYEITWYKNENRSEGGFSLEQIDVKNPCGEFENWSASADEKGGTPCGENSVIDENLDLQLPELERVAFISNNKISLIFNEKLDTSKIFIKSFSVENFEEPKKMFFGSPTYKSVILEFENDFENSKIYNVNLDNEIFDCVGNSIKENSNSKFSIPEKADFSDILINEILFNPRGESADFIEIYNSSNKTIDLKDIFIAEREENFKNLKNLKQIYESSFLIFPKEFKVLTKDIENIKNEFFCKNENNFIEIKDLQNLSNENGNFILCNRLEEIIDEFYYNENMHFALLSSYEGVSLERISYENETNDKNNWFSASETVGFATPTYENSQHSDFKEITEEIILSPEVFTPNNDGKEDFVKINYKFNENGYIGNLMIFDSKGRKVKTLINNELLSLEGFFIWNGLNENNEKLKIGMYIIFLEIFNLDGIVKNYKKNVVIAH